MPESAVVASPCTGVCRMDAQTGWCQGCLRSLDEIVRWGRADGVERRQVLAEVAARADSDAGQATLMRGLPAFDDEVRPPAGGAE